MRRNSHSLLAAASAALAAVLLIAGGLLLGLGLRAQHRAGPARRPADHLPAAAAFAHPKAGTEITPNMIPSVSQYAGQQLLTGQQAEAYADHFIAQHIADMSGGKTYSQLSAASLAQPGNTQLAGPVATVFKGETLRSMLLNAYGWWKVSQITYIVALVGFGLGTAAAFAAGLALATGRRTSTAARHATPGQRRQPGQGRMTATIQKATTLPPAGADAAPAGAAYCSATSLLTSSAGMMQRPMRRDRTMRTNSSRSAGAQVCTATWSAASHSAPVTW